MKIFLLADYWAGLQIAQFLKSRNEDIVGLATHPPRLEKQINFGYTKRIKETLDLPQTAILDGDMIQTSDGINAIRDLNPDIILVVFWGLILKKELIDIPQYGCINFHCSYLPFNRGRNPNVWPIVEDTPAGVSLHYIDEGIDSGDIIAQSIVDVSNTDTAESLYNKLTHEIVSLFKNTWPKIKSKQVKGIKQNSELATSHRVGDLNDIDLIDMDKMYTARDLINILRARTFKPFPSAYYIDEYGNKIFVRIELSNT